MTLLYIDTNIYMDYFDGRSDYLRPLGEFAFQVFKRTLSCEFHIVISSVVLDELLYHKHSNEMSELLSELKEKNKCILVKATPEDRNKAKELQRERKTEFNDTLHAIIAQRMNVSFLVTRNIKDFFDLEDVKKVITPELL